MAEELGKIPREKDNGFNVKEAFEHAYQVQTDDPKTAFWSQTKPEIDAKYEEDEPSFWSKLTSCFQSPLKCNPGVQIDYRGRKVQKNPLQTAFIDSPQLTTITFKDAQGNIEFELKNNELIVEEKKDNEMNELELIDEKTQYLIVQVLDNEIERGKQDRVIAEALLTFVGFDKKGTNYCNIAIFDSVKAEQSGNVLLSAELSDTALHITVEKILDLSDPTAELVKDDSTVQRDVIILIAWTVYMVLSIIFYIYGESFIFIDALYLRVVTAFTVGYGDMYPVTNLGKLLNCLFIIIDSVAIGFLTSKVMNYILRFREIQKEKRDAAKRKGIADAEEQKQREAEAREKESVENEEQKHESDDGLDDVLEKVGDEVKEAAEITKKAASNFWSQYKLYILGGIIVFFIVSGTLFMIYVEGQDAASAFEWNFVTLSTVGYGDVTPQTRWGKVFTIFYIMFGVSLVVMFGTAIFDRE